VGIVWRGNQRPKPYPERSIDAAPFARALDVPGITFVSLQLDTRPDELAALGGDVLDIGRSIRDVADTAAIIAGLGLVISIDTGVAHIAGAVDMPVWTLIGFAPDWRWLLKRDDSPWYPTMRLFRQLERGAWEPVLAVVRSELGLMAQRHCAKPSGAV
jgi:hypothetical protein